MFYVVLEVQQTNSGAKACLNYVYDDYNQALAKLYTVLSAAAVSDIPYHAAFVISDNGTMTDGKVFDRRVEV